MMIVAHIHNPYEDNKLNRFKSLVEITLGL